MNPERVHPNLLWWFIQHSLRYSKGRLGIRFPDGPCDIERNVTETLRFLPALLSCIFS